MITTVPLGRIFSDVNLQLSLCSPKFSTWSQLSFMPGSNAFVQTMDQNSSMLYFKIFSISMVSSISALVTILPNRMGWWNVGIGIGIFSKFRELFCSILTFPNPFGIMPCLWPPTLLINCLALFNIGNVPIKFSSTSHPIILFCVVLVAFASLPTLSLTKTNSNPELLHAFS